MKCDFSFLVMSYNHEKYVVEHLDCIKFLVKKYGKDLLVDLIVNDDASKDNTVVLIVDWIKHNSGLFRNQIQAAFLNVKLKYLENENRIRRNVAEYYLKNISNYNLILPLSSKSEENVWHLFFLRTCNRDKFQNYLKENDIESLIHYPIPPHKQKCYLEFNQKYLPITEKIHDEVLSLPISPVINFDEVRKICEVVNSY